MTHTQPVARDTRRMNSIVVVGSILAVLILPVSASAELPGAIAAPGEALVATFHAQGAQIYECTADAAGKLVWQFREPIATLLVDGKTRSAGTMPARAGNWRTAAPWSARLPDALPAQRQRTSHC